MLSELGEAILGPDEGPWEVTWVSGRDEKGNLIHSKRRFREEWQARLFVDDNCGRGMVELMGLMEPHPAPLQEEKPAA